MILLRNDAKNFLLLGSSFNFHLSTQFNSHNSEFSHDLTMFYTYSSQDVYMEETPIAFSQAFITKAISAGGFSEPLSIAANASWHSVTPILSNEGRDRMEYN